MALRFYKHGQGKLSRGLAGMGMGLFGFFGSYRLYLWLGAYDFFKKPLPLLPNNLLGAEMPANYALLVGLGLLIGTAVGTYYISNHPRVADFLLETEAEMKKVSWPSVNEVWGSSVVVLIVTIIFGVYLLGVDYGLGSLRGFLRSVFG